MLTKAACLASAIVVCIPALPAAAASPGDTAAPIRAVTPRGAVVELIEEHPPGPGPFPAVVLASGSGYDMRQPILERVAHALVAAGVGVIRFDWAYHVRDPEHGKQSADRAAEIEDLTTVVARARKAAWVDPSRIVVGGKSLGSIIAWRVLRHEPDLKGALLLTPVCSPKPKLTPTSPGPPSSPIVDGNYPDVRTETRPTDWLLGKNDPACAPSILYQHLAAAGGSAQVDVVPGDHTFSEGSSSGTDERSLDLVARLSVDFAMSVLARPRATAEDPPRAFEYVRRGETPLHLYVFPPPVLSPSVPPRTAGAILLVHGGGWTRGRPSLDGARRFATAGLVGIAVEYRLTAGAVTPVEAFEDTCEAFRWVRAHAGDLGVDPRHVAGYGASAGGVMVAATATAGCPSPGKSGRTTEGRPDALVLLSTGFDLEHSETFRKLSRPESNPADYSPLAHLAADLPPTFVAQGTEDSVTPLGPAQTFCSRARALGRACDLQIYPGLGHLLTRNLADQRNSADPDPQAAGDALAREIRFLSSLGFTSAISPPATATWEPAPPVKK